VIDRQKKVFNENGISEDILDRLKMMWKKNLQEE